MKKKVVTAKTIERAKRISKIRKERLKAEIKELNGIKKSSLKTRVISVFFVLAVLIGFIIYTINVDGIENINHIMETADYKWFIIGLVILVIGWGFEALSLHVPLKKMYPKQKYVTTFQSNVIGKLFNNITPFSSGGQPFQAYLLSKHGLRASDTLSALMMKFIVYQVALFSWALVLFVINIDFFNETFHNYIWLVILGFMLNLIATLAIFLAGINKNIVIKILNPIIKFAAKFKIIKKLIIKDLDATLKSVDESVSNFSKQFNGMKKQRPTIIKMYLFELIQLLAYFSIPFVIYNAFENTGTSYIEIITVQTFLLLIMSFIPTPGSGLGAEGGFSLLYGTIFVTGLNMANLFWRIYTFYLPIIIGTLVLLLINRRVTNEIIKKELHE